MTQQPITPATIHHLKNIIDAAWDCRDTLRNYEEADPAFTDAMSHVLSALNDGLLRICEKQEGKWTTLQWLKKAILLSFRLNPSCFFTGGPTIHPSSPGTTWSDKVPLKTDGWSEEDFQTAGFRAVPGAIIRHSAYIDKNVILMPSFVNVGARIGQGTMIDTWATVGSCAQIGENCHLSGGAGIGGVLEPVQASPVIIEDNCFIGARSEIVEGVIVEEGAVISMGVFLGASTKIVHRDTGEIMYGRVPAYSVVVPGTLPGKTPQSPHLACAVIVKQVDAQTRAKTSINDLLRE